jgi:hypothetical protein
VTACRRNGGSIDRRRSPERPAGSLALTRTYPTAMAALHRSAASLGATLTPGDIAIERAGDAAARRIANGKPADPVVSAHRGLRRSGRKDRFARLGRSVPRLPITKDQRSKGVGAAESRDRLMVERGRLNRFRGTPLGTVKLFAERGGP